MLPAHLGLSGRPILVCAADVNSVEAPQAAEAGVAVGAQHAADDVAEVRHIVDVRQRACDQDVLLPCGQSQQTLSARGRLACKSLNVMEAGLILFHAGLSCLYRQEPYEGKEVRVAPGMGTLPTRD